MIPRQSFTRQILFKTWKSFFHIHHCKKIKRERLECHLYGQLIAILLCSSTMFQMWQLLLMKKKRELSEYKAIYMMKDYFFLLFQSIQNILRLVVQTKALVRTTIFYIVEVKRRSWVSWDPESVYKTNLFHLPYLNQFLVCWSSRSCIRNENR
ncbi:Transposase for insertion sequence element IS231B [Bacillus thuringiensis serovar pulsiensis BGSC 4CC1]|nr:Transposase for insertion sequence element IS231B [Bacillus thuringiensis serovar pulsiensis BGSC 4CC1]